MPIPFPPLRPTSRAYTTADYPVASPEFAAGIAYPRLWGQTASNAVLQLQFDNITDAQAVAILSSYAASRGGFHPLTLPPEIVSGIELLDLRYKIANTNYLLWHYAEPPKVEARIPGISSVTVSLVATLSKTPFIAQNLFDSTNTYDLNASSLTMVYTPVTP